MGKHHESERPAIAVLPFTNLSEDPQQEYFSDGITIDIITDLSKFHHLFVIATNTVFTYKGKSVKVTEVGKELSVQYVLEGSVQEAGERVMTFNRLRMSYLDLFIFVMAAAYAQLGRIEDAKLSAQEVLRRHPFFEVESYGTISIIFQAWGFTPAALPVAAMLPAQYPPYCGA